MLAYTRTRDAARWLPWLRRVDAYCRRVFCPPGDAAGGWFGYADRGGALSASSPVKGGNYKGFFHVPRALLMCAQRCRAYFAGRLPAPAATPTAPTAATTTAAGGSAGSSDSDDGEEGSACLLYTSPSPRDA